MLGSSYFFTEMAIFCYAMGAPELGAVSRAYKRIAFVLMAQLLEQLPKENGF